MSTKIYRKPHCPYGKKAVALLQEKNIKFEDHFLETKESEEAFKEEHGVKTTPQIFIDGERIGGYTDLAKKFGVEVATETGAKDDGKSYTPIIAIFLVSILLTVSTAATMLGWMGFFLTLLATQKLIDLQSFRKSFANYDLITQKIPVYALIYPFAELLTGVGYLSGVALTYVSVISIVIGFFGSISVIKAVYIDKRDLNCACAGGNTKLPLGFVSLSENAIMFLMGVWILISLLG